MRLALLIHFLSGFRLALKFYLPQNQRKMVSIVDLALRTTRFKTTKKSKLKFNSRVLKHYLIMTGSVIEKKYLVLQNE